MIGWPTPVFKPFGVNWPNADAKVTLPLLLTNTVGELAPKKLAAKPIATAAVEPSSLAGNVFVAEPAGARTAAENAGKATASIAAVVKVARNPCFMGGVLSSVPNRV
jgi:hypothetical protein